MKPTDIRELDEATRYEAMHSTEGGAGGDGDTEMSTVPGGSPQTAVSGRRMAPMRRRRPGRQNPDQININRGDGG